MVIYELPTSWTKLNVEGDPQIGVGTFRDVLAVLVWRRGARDGDRPVVVVANFSDFATDTSAPNAEYRVPNWPATPPGRRWREVTQERDVPREWVAREPIFAWEAKVYTLV
jgi:hypothetical protein